MRVERCCSMLEEPAKSFEKILYGDNAAAISMAYGTGTSSWRTRHLRVRASFLKEALDGVTMDGIWKLFHLRGTELVADGLTKPLYGQAFFKFVEDLGMAHRELEMEPGPHPQDGGAANGAALRAMVLGSMLLSAADAKPTEDEQQTEDFTLVWVTGILLMAMGAVYTGQLLHGASKICLKRLRELRNRAESAEDESIIVVSGDERELGATSSSSSMAPVQGPCSATSASSLTLRPRSGSNRAMAPTPKGRARKDRPADAQLNALAAGTELTPEQGPSTSRLSSTSMSSQRQSGLEQQAAFPVVTAVPADVASNLAAVPFAAAERGRSGETPDEEIQNPWNFFQRKNKGKGWRATTMARMYNRQKLGKP